MSENKSPEQDYYDLILRLSNIAFSMSKLTDHDLNDAVAKAYDICNYQFFTTCMLMGKPIITKLSDRQIFIEEAKLESVKEDAEHDDLTNIKFG